MYAEKRGFSNRHLYSEASIGATGLGKLLPRMVIFCPLPVVGPLVGDNEFTLGSEYSQNELKSEECSTPFVIAKIRKNLREGEIIGGVMQDTLETEMKFALTSRFPLPSLHIVCPRLKPDPIKTM